jgi:hypothetical protein
LHCGQTLGGLAAVTKKPQFPHFQYVIPQDGQMSPANFPSPSNPQCAQIDLFSLVDMVIPLKD